MSLIQIEQLTKSFGALILFSSFSVAISRGEKIALIGDNGVGKSTLLAIITGLEAPSEGKVHRTQGIRIAYLPQVARLAGDETLVQTMRKPFYELIEMEKELRQLEEEMAKKSDPQILHRYDDLLHIFQQRGGYTIETKIRSVLTGLGFTTEEFDNPTKLLSSGEEARAALARILLEEPDLLLLDEPTNHLDFAALDWLEETLLEFPGALILVSHDRHLLDRVTSRTWEIAFGEFNSYRGGYTQSRLLREAEANRQRQVYERQQATIERHKEFIRRHHAGQKYRQAKDREKKIERIEKELIERPRVAKYISLKISMERSSGKKVFILEDLEIGFKSRLFTCPDLTLYRGERVAIIGENGCGKTTLLRTITGEIPPLAGRIELGHGVRIANYSQTQEALHGKGTVLDAILSRSTLSIGQARSLLGLFLFSEDDVMKKLSALSGGERSRVALALLSLMEGNLLLLDEPTNHLDLKSQEILEEALLSYKGTILLVSHDRALLESVATKVWEIRDGALRVFLCNYQDYQRRRTSEFAPVKPGQQGTRKKRSNKGQLRKEKPDRYQERRRLQQIRELEEKIERLEDDLKQIEKDLLDASNRSNRVQVTKLGEEHDRLTQTLHECYRKWENMMGPID